MTWNKEEDLKLKYAYIDGESNPRYKKKAKKKAVRKANHKHEWCNCTIETTYPQNYGVPKLNGQPTKLTVSYCPVCGKVNYLPQIDKHVARRLPKGASLWSYRVDDTEKMKKLREAKMNRNTAETQIELELRIDGNGTSDIRTDCGFLNHMLTSR